MSMRDEMKVLNRELDDMRDKNDLLRKEAQGVSLHKLTAVVGENKHQEERSRSQPASTLAYTLTPL